jgi:hypothetical protein
MSETALLRKAILILWPSFVFGGIGTVLFFTLHDPVDLYFVGPLELGRKAGYTLGFFFFWAVAAGSSWLTWLLERRAEEVNRCPLGPVERPVGCPKREEPDAAR